jgi:hypothetical protein
MKPGEVIYSEAVRVDSDERRLIVQWADSGDVSIVVKSDIASQSQTINLPRAEVSDLVACLTEWLDSTED